MFARLGSPEFSSDPVLRAEAGTNADHATPDTGSTRLEGICRRARNIGLGRSQEVAKSGSFFVVTHENAIGNDRGEYAFRTQELVCVQYMRCVVTPLQMVDSGQWQLEIRKVRDSAEWKQLRSLLLVTSVAPSGQSHDHRTAVLLFDQSGRRIASVYFDQLGGGTMNGDSGDIKGGMYQWAKSLLKGIAQ